MNGPLHLLCCRAILVALLCLVEVSQVVADDNGTTEPTLNQTTESSTHRYHGPNDKTEADNSVGPEITEKSPPTMAYITQPSPSKQQPKTTTTTIATSTTTTTPTTTASNWMLYKKECLTVFMVAGGLILGCAILLVSTLLLSWKVCQLSRRLKMLSSNADLISNTNYWMGTAKKNKSTSDTEAKETSVLMADFTPTQGDVGNGTTKEEGGKVNEDGQLGEENNKEVLETANSEEASPGQNKTMETPVTEDSSSTSKPQEETTNSQAIEAAAASNSGDKEEPKDVV